MKITPKRPRLKYLLVTISILILLGAGGAVWWLYQKPISQTSSEVKQSPVVTAEPTTPDTSVDPTPSVPTDVPPESLGEYRTLADTDQFKIRQQGTSSNYTITLYAIINRPDQYAMYRDQLREYKQAALDYLKKNGIDVTKITITYEPSEAAQL